MSWSLVKLTEIGTSWGVAVVDSDLKLNNISFLPNFYPMMYRFLVERKAERIQIEDQGFA